MSILTRYLSWHLLKNILSVLLLLIIVFSIFSVLAELEIVQGSDGFKLIPLFWLFEVILLCYDLIPFAVLIGSVLGLSYFVNTNQMIIMQISGFSVKYQSISIIFVGVVIFVFAFIIGELFVPVAKKLKAEIQLSLGEQKDFTLIEKGFWARNQNVFFKVDTLLGDHIVEGVELYEFDDNMELLSILTAKSGFHNGTAWVFEESSFWTFQPKYSFRQFDSFLERQLPIGPEIMEMVVYEQEDDSIFSLFKYLKVAEKTSQNTKDLYLNIFEKFGYWLNIFGFLVLSHLIVRLSLSRFSGSKNVFIAICVGFGYFMLGKILNQAGLVFSYPPFFIAMMPSILLLLFIYLLTLLRS